MLTEHLLHKLLIPLYIYSLTGSHEALDMPTTSFDSSSLEYHDASSTTKAWVSPVVALFLLSQVFLILSHAPLVSTLAWIILKADKSIFGKACKRLLEEYMIGEKASVEEGGEEKPSGESAEVKNEEGSVEEQQNATDEEKLLVTTPTENVVNSPFFDVVLKALDCSENDHAALFALSLLYALGNNKGTAFQNAFNCVKSESEKKIVQIMFVFLLKIPIKSIKNL